VTLVRLTRFARERGIPERTLGDWRDKQLLNRATGLHTIGATLFIHPGEFDRFFVDNDELLQSRNRGRKKKTTAPAPPVRAKKTRRKVSPDIDAAERVVASLTGIDLAAETFDHNRAEQKSDEAQRRLALLESLGETESPVPVPEFP
jgi:TATA-binding protein-associated factor Taf7